MPVMYKQRGPFQKRSLKVGGGCLTETGVRDGQPVPVALNYFSSAFEVGSESKQED